MRRLSTRLYPTLCTVLLALALVFAGLQQAWAHNPPVQQPNGMHEDIHSQHDQSSHSASNCSTDCAGTAHNCCLYALCANLPLTRFQQSSTQHSLLPYFFSSRAITPLTQPPKLALS